MFQYEMLFNAG